MQTRIGRPSPLGARWDGGGVNFAVTSPSATGVRLCLFGSSSPQAVEQTLSMYRGRGGVWHLWVAGVLPGQAYGYRADGPYDPPRGRRFNAAKILVDPYARAVAGDMNWHPALIGDRQKDGSRHPAGACDLDSAPYAPRSLVVDPTFDWGADEAPPRTPWRRTVIYECHVRGLTQRHPEVPPADRGRYLGVAAEAVIDHLRRLGVTAVELLPVQQFVNEPQLQRRGLTNYWGYNPLAWMAPHAAYAGSDQGAQVVEFKQMVRHLHAAGLELILDIVFNHTAEGDGHGPTLTLRGLADDQYYRHSSNGAYEDYTGCGNTLDVRQPIARRLVLDALRYWVEEMHVDGFRLDLAPVLGRSDRSFEPLAPLFEAIRSEPRLAEVKWIAEPWDLGPDGYQLGRFPAPFAEWNDRFRDASRATWAGNGGSLPELVKRLEGSPDLFTESRGPCASINFVTAHDGQTLCDWTTYEKRHNEANGEHNRDGHPHLLSRHWGVEGPTSEPSIVFRREAARRNLIAMLGLGRGVPMLSHGDELGRTQNGNNNAYCQDNETTWIDWRLRAQDKAFLEFVGRLFAVRGRLLDWLQPAPGRARRDWEWLDGAGERLDEATLSDAPLGPPLGLLAVDDDGGHRALLWLNAGADRWTVRVPSPTLGWRVALATVEPASTRVRGEIDLPPWSFLLLEPTQRPPAAAPDRLDSMRSGVPGEDPDRRQ